MGNTLDPEPQVPTEELTRENLASPASVEMLGAIAVASLQKYGEATFVMRPDNGVAYVEPWKVSMEPNTIQETFERPFRLVRPILGDGQPRLTVWKNGVLWEIEFVDEQSKENSSS